MSELIPELKNVNEIRSLLKSEEDNKLRAANTEATLNLVLAVVNTRFAINGMGGAIGSLGKKIEKGTNDIISISKEVANSNNRHATAMKWLTAALVLIGAIQVITSFF